MRHTLFGIFLLGSLSAFAQSPCDSLEILNISSHPFTDSLILLEVENTSSEFFSYPQFVMFNGANDTVAFEELNYFGISSFSQHHLKVATNDSFEFASRIELWTIGDTVACEFVLPVDLCPKDLCIELLIGVQNFGGALADGEVVWSVFDTNLTKLATGNLTLIDTAKQEDYATLCLPIGDYRFEYAASGPLGGQVYANVLEMEHTIGLNAQLSSFAAIIELELYGNCEDETLGFAFEAENNKSMSAWIEEGELKIESLESIRSLQIVDLQGREIHSSKPLQRTLSIPFNYPKGLYFILDVENLSSVRLAHF